jgi:hypothetical protein
LAAQSWKSGKRSDEPDSEMGLEIEGRDEGSIGAEEELLLLLVVLLLVADPEPVIVLVTVTVEVRVVVPSTVEVTVEPDMLEDAA